MVASLQQGGATWNQWRFAAVAAHLQGRYKEMMKAMQQAKVEPLITDELIQIGIVEEARSALLDTVDVRGLTLLPAERRRIRTEVSIDRLRRWRRRAVVVPSSAEIFAEEPTPHEQR